MNKTIILPIKPEYMKKIFTGEKTYEYRTQVPKEDIKRIIFYVTAPIKKIVGEAKVIDILKLPPNELWQVSQNKSGITKTFFDTYFNGRKFAYAYKLGKVKVYNALLNLKELGIKNPPQSFLYLKN